jgi:hypothetical protein
MEISVDGFRGDPDSRDIARAVPASELPKLTDAQREMARKLGSTEEEYARILIAGQKNQEKLVKKTERVARLLTQILKRIAPDAELKSVALRVFQERFDVEIVIGDEVIPVSINEQIIDSYFDAGSIEADQALKRIIERAISVRA